MIGLVLNLLATLGWDKSWRSVQESPTRRRSRYWQSRGRGAGGRRGEVARPAARTQRPDTLIAVQAALAETTATNVGRTQLLSALATTQARVDVSRAAKAVTHARIVTGSTDGTGRVVGIEGQRGGLDVVDACVVRDGDLQRRAGVAQWVCSLVESQPPGEVGLIRRK